MREGQFISMSKITNAVGLPIEDEAALLAQTEFPEEDYPLPDQTPEDLGVEKEG